MLKHIFLYCRIGNGALAKQDKKKSEIANPERLKEHSMLKSVNDYMRGNWMERVGDTSP
jgi:hypothetical protein